MTDRDKLIELKRQAINYAQEKADERGGLACIDDEVDHPLTNGIIVPPCKVGDKTFLLLEKILGGYEIVESECVRISENKSGKVYSMAIDCAEIGNTLEFHLDDFGKWVFRTKEEAEAKLKELNIK